VSRYNPETNRAQKVPADSWEAENWPSRKPSQAGKKARQKLERQLTHAAERAVTDQLRKAASPRARATYGKVIQGGVLVAGAVARGAVGAGVLLAVHEAAKYILQDMPSLDPVIRMERISLRYREARRDLAARLGRALNESERRALADAWRQAVAREKRETETERQRSIK